MSIYATELAVASYRSFDDLNLPLSAGVNILVGRNAAGKTNLIEALQLLTAGQSFRHPAPSALIREGCGRGRISLRLEGEGRLIEHACDLEPRRRTFSRNGKKVTSAGVRGVLPCVLFCPDHLDMVKRSAAVRRAALDDFGMQLNDRYAHLVASYERIVEQRNNLLRDRAVDPGLLMAWNESLVRTGTSLMMHRGALLERVRAHFREAYAAIAGGEEADAVYQPSIERNPDEESLGRDPRVLLEDAFYTALGERADEELRRGMTLAGPHRDEILFTVGGRAARTFGSQGQQRSIVLAWKIAEVAVTRDILGYAPLLLLDDVMSELDEARREAMLSFVEGGVQTVITTTNLGYFSETVLGRAKVVAIGGEV